ncbi:cyclin-like protein [Peziza echinospora]|nr:cyclin-like protein [Peziza echinospora]
MVRSRQTACCSNPAHDDADGQTVCMNCGSVVSESQIVSEISFGETSAGAAVVQGSLIGMGETHARNTGPFRKGGGLESREQTLANARRRIQQLAAALSVPDSYTDSASRWFTLALTNGFTHGRKTQYVVACCLYAVCRQESSSHMLIDFSDILHINVFTLGQTYLKLVRLLHIPTTTIDPSVYIHRFAKHLEFGKDTMKVASDATRLVQRMNRDWIVQGRRPSGICGASLLLAARMNNYRRSVRELVYVVKVADLTIQKRLEEFKLTKSGSLTVDEFRNMWLEQAHDPPSFGPKKTKKRKRVREVNENGEVVGEEEEDSTATPSPAKRAATPRQATVEPQPQPPQPPRVDADGFAIPELPIDPALLLLDSAGPHTAMPTPPTTQDPSASTPSDQPEQEDHITAIAEAAIESEIENIINNNHNNSTHPRNSEEREGDGEEEDEEDDARSHSHNSDDDETDLSAYDDWETNSALLTEAETLVKERIWVELNKEYLKEQEAKKLKAERDRRNGVGRSTRRKRGGRKGGMGGGAGGNGGGVPASPAESAKEMLAKRTYSKKINYAALDHLFQED